MELTIKFTEKNLKRLVSENEVEGYRLKEVQRHKDGKRLIFTNEPYFEGSIEAPSRYLSAEFDELKAKLVDKGIISYEAVKK